jgi:glycosyltransferase involved in cell wall biosynthesis
MPSKSEPSAPLSLLVAIPCLNEEQTIARVINDIPREIQGIGKIEVLVIDDGSTDQTALQAQKKGAQVKKHQTTRGLGITFREAVEVALLKDADVLVHIDGDGQFDSKDIPQLVGPVVAKHAHMVTASRFADRKLVPTMPAVKRWGNQWIARIVWLLTGQRFHDVSCGFRAFSREALLRMNLFGSFTYTQEAFLDLTFKNLSILEVPVKVRGTREFGTSRMAASIPRYALRSLQIMLRAFISYRPFTLFCFLGSLFLCVGLTFLSFLGWHYVQTGAFSPHIWAGFIGGSFGFMGISTLIIGLVGDMLVRIRMNQEHILYHLKNKGSGNPD